MENTSNKKSRLGENEEDESEHESVEHRENINHFDDSPVHEVKDQSDDFDFKDFSKTVIPRKVNIEPVIELTEEEKKRKQIKEIQKSITDNSNEMNSVFNQAKKEFSVKNYNDALANFYRAEQISIIVQTQLQTLGRVDMINQLQSFIDVIRANLAACKEKVTERFNEVTKVKKTNLVNEIVHDLYQDKIKKLNKEKQGLIQSQLKEKQLEQLTSKPVVADDLRSKIENEIMCKKPGVKFDEIIGMQSAKKILNEIIVLPTLRPEFFTGIRAPPRGVLLFGPPGTGKTMLAKAVATECECTFFNISAAALTSKYVGESEKLVKHLFELAFEKSPAIIFIDEIESILSSRNNSENAATQRLKTEFMIQFDGVASATDAKLLVIGATNRPYDLDLAVIRRLPKRIYVGPFEEKERAEYVEMMMKQIENTLSEEDLAKIASFTEGYSNSDLKELVKEAAYEPIRELSAQNTFKNVDKLRAIELKDFEKAVKNVRGTIKEKDLKDLMEWNESFGALG